MAGRGDYTVGPGEPFAEIQEAITALILDQGTDAFTEEQRITVTSDGVYQPFEVPSDALSPTSAARLVIQSSPGIQATISGHKNPQKYAYGCLVGNNVPYVTVRRLLFRNLKRGIVYGANSHRGIIDKCTLLSCGNVGAWFYQADEGLVSNSVFINNDHGIVGSLCKSIAILHNTLFNDSGFSGTTPWLVYVSLADDRGQGEEDTGVLTLKNNILFAQAGGGVLVYEKDVTHIDSDYNDMWSPGDGPIVEVREPTAGGGMSQDQIQTLPAWQIRAGADDHSLSEEPSFIKPAHDEVSAAIDLGLLANTDIAGKGKLLADVDVPDYVDPEIVAVDFNDNDRLDPPAIGAHDVATVPSFYGHDVFSDEEDDTNETCGGDLTAYDRAMRQYAAAVSCWNPKVHKGYFYSRDREYFLYAAKRGLTLREAHYTHFPLTVPLVEVDEVLASGTDVKDTAFWLSEGLTFTIHHAETSLEDGDSEVEVRGYYLKWNNDDLAFTREYVRHRWKVREGVQEYALPSNPVDACPVVITDDTVHPLDALEGQQEFRTRYDAEDDVTLIDFLGANNLWENPEFHYYTGDTPLGYEYDGAVGVSTGDQFGRPLRGERFLLLDSGDSSDFIGQRIPIEEEGSYTLSMYASSRVYGADGGFSVELSFLDQMQVEISSVGPLAATVAGTTGDTASWERFGLSFYRTYDDTPGRPTLADRVNLLHTGIEIPADTRSVFVTIHPGAVDTAIDCIQLEAGQNASTYNRLPHGDDMTIEYETSESRFYSVDDLTLNPVRNAFTSGFLTIQPLPATQFDTEAEEGATTLSDTWVDGRLTTLPWAHTKAYNKYNRVVRERLERLPAPQVIAGSPEVAYPKDIRVTPSLIVARQSSVGENFSVEISDENDNPHAFELVEVTAFDSTGEFPGYIALKMWGYYIQLGQTVQGETNEAGAGAFTWIPPASEDVEYRGDLPTIESGQEWGYVDVKYRVYGLNHGDAQIRDQFNNRISVRGTELTGQFAGTYNGSKTVVDIDDYPVPGTIELRSDEDGGTSKVFAETLEGEPGAYEYAVDYERGLISLAGNWDQPVQIVYTPRLIWKDPGYPRRLYIDSSIITTITGDISIQYDAELGILVEATPPTGQEYVTPVWSISTAVAQHNDRV